MNRTFVAWALVALAAIALVGGLGLVYAQRTVFRADGFAARADAAMQRSPVRAVVARRLTGAVLAARPDLVAARPLLDSAAAVVIGTPAFRSLVRGAARDIHRSAFDRHAATVTLALTDTGLLVRDAIAALSPDVARRVPAGVDARIARVSGEAQTAALRLVEAADRVRRVVPIVLGLALLLGAGAVVVSRSLRAGVLRLGVAVAACAGLVAIAAVALPRLVDPAPRAALGVWTQPLAGWALGLAAAVAVVALAAASVLRPVPVGPSVRRAARAIAATPEARGARAGRAIALGLLGAGLVAWPSTLLRIAATLSGALLVLAAIAELLRLSAGPAPAAHAAVPRARVAIAGGLLAIIAIGVGALAAGGAPVRPLVGRCNGSAALCDRRLDAVAFAGTHNSMAADGEPGWLFAAQDAGIEHQLDDGIRALLIDTHFGFATPKGVATQLAAGSKSREKIAAEVGETFVETAKRLRARIGYQGGGEPEVFLCHAYCEVGATPAVAALAGVHRFLVTHPEEVLILSFEDDTPAATTAELLDRSRLAHEVYRGPARPPWPTLRELIDRDERVLVLAENHPDPSHFIHAQPVVAQETPYRFRSVASLGAPDSCRPNRGGTAGSLFLVNHWVDTSPAPRPSIADEVNARAFLDRRMALCRRTRHLLPTIVAVDFYGRGDVFGAVRALNATP
jgi:hypothetical protein